MAEMRLIDACGLAEKFQLRGQAAILAHDDGTLNGMRAALFEIAYSPTVDAVPVVRCKDCKWYREGKLLAPHKFCFRLKHPKEDRHIGYNFSPDDFCSYGERKEQ